jgi:hypothetical protein
LEVDRNAVGIVSKQYSMISNTTPSIYHYCYDEYSNRIFKMNTAGSSTFDELDGTTFKDISNYSQSSQSGSLYDVSCAVRRGKYVYGFGGASSASFAYITQYDTENGTIKFISKSDKIDKDYTSSTGLTTLIESTHKNYVYLYHNAGDYCHYYRIEFDDNGELTKITNLNDLLTGVGSTYYNYAAPGVIKKVHNSNYHWFAYSFAKGYANNWVCGMCDFSLENPVIWKYTGNDLFPFTIFPFRSGAIMNLFIYKHHLTGEYYSVATNETSKSIILQQFNATEVIQEKTLTQTTESLYIPKWCAGKVYKNVAFVVEVLGTYTEKSQAFWAKINDDGTWDFLSDGAEIDTSSRYGTDIYYKYPYPTVGYAMYNSIANMNNDNHGYTESSDGRLRFIELKGSNWEVPAFLQMSIKIKED